MYDTTCWRDPHPEIAPGSTIHAKSQQKSDDEDTLLTKGTNGSAIELPTGRLLHRDDVVAIRARRNGLYIETSLSRDPTKPWGPNVFSVNNPHACKARVEQVSAHLRHLGIHTDLDEAYLSKAHLCTDILTDEPYQEYLLAFQACGMQKLCQAELSKFRAFREKLPKQSRRPLGEHTYGHTCSYRARVVYSKLPHLEHDKSCREYAHAVQRSIGERSVLRFESRLNKAAAVKRHLGITRGSHLYEHWDLVAQNRLALIDEAFGSSSDLHEESVGGSVGPPGSLSLTKSIVEAKGKGATAAWFDFAVEGLAARLKRGQDVEADRARLLAADVRPGDIDKAIDEMMQFVNATDRTVDALRRELQHRLRADPFEWPHAP